MDQCCNMANEGCCTGPEQGQRCYTVYEKQCKYVNEPQCMTNLREKCENHPVKSCRDVDKFEDVQIPVSDCRVKTEQQCWSYDKKVCKDKMETFTKNFTWVTESVQGGEETKEMCAKVRKCNIVDETRTETTRVPERKCEKVPSTRRKCGTVTVPQPPMEVPYTDYKTEYKQQCYNVPKPVCQQRPCTYQVQTQNLCPTCVSPGVPGPSCGQATPCGGGPAPAPLPGAEPGAERGDLPTGGARLLRHQPGP